MGIEAFTAPGRFWRGNLHTHSTLSDGVVAPEEVCRRYRAAGYDFLVLSEHFVGMFGYPVADTVPYRTEGFTTLPGAELHVDAMSNGEIWHMLAVGLPADFAPPDAPDFRPRSGQERMADLAARAREAGAFVTIPHPHWSGLTLEDALAIESAHAVELYNHGCAVECDRGDGVQIHDLLLSRGRRLFGIATDDAHFAMADHFGGWVMVKAEENAPEALLAALKAGHFYASQGPELRDVRLEGDRIVVESTPVEAVIVQGAGSANCGTFGRAMTRAEVTITPRLGASDWLRVTVVDAAGRRAWANPIWVR